MMKNIKKIIRSDDAFEILDNSNCSGTDWGSGGCAILAQALNKLEGYPIVVIYNLDYDGPEHFGVITPSGAILDHDGEHKTSRAWVRFFIENEQYRGGALTVNYYTPDMNMDGVKFDQKASDELAKLIDSYKSIEEDVDKTKKYLEFRDEHLDSYKGQHNMELGAYIDDEIIGMVQYVLYDGELTVSDIIVRPEYRRQGFASRMMQYIKNKHKDYIYKPSMKTDLGAVFKHKNFEEPSKLEIRKITNQVIREEVLEETQTGQKDLEKFANDILKLLANEIIKEKAHMVFLTDNKKEPITSFPMANTIMMNGGEFSEIGEFVESTDIKIIPATVIKGKPGIKGQLEYGQDLYKNDYYKILLKYNSENLNEINELLNKEEREITQNDVYFKIYYMFYSTLLHELQHAYDAWRSKGKAFGGQLKKSYTSLQNKARAIASSKSGYDEMTPEEIEAVKKSYAAYQNLVHEINARYAQAMHNLQLTTMDFKTFDDVKKEWDKVYKEFKIKFDGWINLSDKMKRKLTRRLAKAYQEAVDGMKTAKEKYTPEELEMVSEKYVRKMIKESLYEITSQKRIVAGVLIKCTTTDNVFLILRNDQKPTWALVSGTVDEGESVISGLKRELYEELFVNPSIIDFKFIRVENMPEKNIEFHYYEGFVDKQFVPILDEENLDSGWFSEQTLPSPLYSGLSNKLEKIFLKSITNSVEPINEVRNIVRKILSEQMIIEHSNNNIDQAINIISENTNTFEWDFTQKDEPSPSFEWDIAKEKIDSSKSYIQTKEQAYEYLKRFFDKIKNLPNQVKIKLAKYVAYSLLGVIGLNAIYSVIPDNMPEVKKEIASIEKAAKKMSVNVEQVRPTTVSDSLINFLKHEEGSISKKGEPVLTAYKLGDGKVTVGWGHAEDIGATKLRPGQTISRELAEQYLMEDIREAQGQLDDILDDWENKGVKVSLDQGKYDAMVSMVYNMGVGTFRKSDFIQQVKKNNFNSALAEIGRVSAHLYDKFPGLEIRRAKEAEMFSGQKQMT